MDASFAVYPNLKSHTGAIMTMGQGATQSVSSEQKVDKRSITEARLVAVDDALV